MRTLTVDEWKHVFDARGNDPRRWRGYAYSLLESSAALLRLWDDWRRGFAERAAGKPEHGEAQPGYHATAMMLRGMACECLLKAVGLERGTLECLARGGGFRPVRALKKRKTTQHDLVALADIVGFELETGCERRALRGMAVAIVAGRYPVVGSWVEERQQYVEGPSLLVIYGEESDHVGDRLLQRLLGGPLPQ
jgi:hypothetical protein